MVHPEGDSHAGKVCEVVIGLQARDENAAEDARWPGYVDGVWRPADMSKCPAVSTWKAKAAAVVSQMAADNGWIANLDAQVEADKARAIPAPDWVAPEVVVDTTLEPAEGSPAAPKPEPEPEPEPEPAAEEEVPAEEDPSETENEGPAEEPVEEDPEVVEEG
jgi:DNA polymerase-3 subunit gamma/tau